MSTSTEGNIKIWNYNTGDCLKTLLENQGYTHQIIPFSDKIIICANSEIIQFWDWESGTCEYSLLVSLGESFDLKILSNGAMMSLSKDYKLRIYA